MTSTAPIALLSISSHSARPHWMEQAACRGHPTSWWFASSTRRHAVRICRRCPVRRECLAYALEQGDELYGVWGGLGSTERRGLRHTLATQLGSQPYDKRGVLQASS
jgi:WhiB family redox-sensing transcriptional regulator